MLAVHFHQKGLRQRQRMLFELLDLVDLWYGCPAGGIENFESCGSCWCSTLEKQERSGLGWPAVSKTGTGKLKYVLFPDVSAEQEQEAFKGLTLELPLNSSLRLSGLVGAATLLNPTGLEGWGQADVRDAASGFRNLAKLKMLANIW